MFLVQLGRGLVLIANSGSCNIKRVLLVCLKTSNMSELVRLYLLILAIVSCQARQHGAPTTACSKLIPLHRGAEAQRTTSPYTVSATKENNKIKVTISSDFEDLSGFALQARFANDKSKIVQGTFTIKNGITKTIDCSGGKQNTLTHTDPSPKSAISTEWTPSETIDSDVIFRASIAKSYSIFFTDVDSAPVYVKSSSSMGQTAQKSTSGNTMLYHNCFVSRGCLGFPAGCIPTENCKFVLSFTNIEGGVAFQMKGALEREYMAFALSDDTKMGEDAVMECLKRDAGAPIMRESWNDGRNNKNTRDIPRSAYAADSNDGFTTCSWNETFVKESNGKTFNFLNSTYFILLAKGPIQNGGIYYHDTDRLSSQQAVNFTAFDMIASSGVDDMIKVHGCLMVTAWVGFVSFAILLARHFKTAFDDKTLFGTKIWFCIHRFLMATSILLVIIAIIIIFVYNKGWNDKLSNPHPVLGIIATALAVCQPIIAAFRPSPDSSKRPIFNWIHFTIGNLAQLIAVITIFYAVPLEASRLDGNFNWVMSIFVVVHILFHILFQVQAWTLGKNKNEVKMIEMSSRISNNIQNVVPDKNPGDSVFRILLLGIYGIFLIAILLAMYALIGVK